MVGDESGGPSKKPRIDKFIDLAEIDDLKEQVRKLEEKNDQLRSLEEQNEQLKTSLKEVQVEKKEVDEALEELRGMVECPVCLLVPRQGGPVPVCSNGHFVCHTCRDRIRQEARLAEREPKCPSCMVDLGNATSLLASRLVERLKHECEQDGCEEKIPFAQLERHQLVCLFRKVLCPGSNCKLQIPFNKMEEHANSCGKIGIVLMDNTWHQYLATNKKDSGDFLTWPTVSFEAHGKLFFVNTKRTKKHIYMFETILLGSEEECKGYILQAYQSSTKT